MSEFRILGKSVTITIKLDGEPVTAIKAVKSFDFEPRHRILTENYLGETASRQDEVFEEVGGSFSVHPEDPSALALQKAIVDRSTERTANQTQVSCSFLTVWPNGKQSRITIPDMKFEPIPFRVGGRDAYVEMSFNFKATGYILSIF